MRRPRRAFSLIELLVAITVASVVLVVGIGTIHLMLRIERRSRQCGNVRATVSHLSRIFRQDVHAATHIEILPTDDGSPRRIELRSADGQMVEYELDVNRLARTESLQDAVRHRDHFDFPIDCRIEFVPEENPQRIAVLVHRPALPGSRVTRGITAESTPESTRLTRIEATVGRDYRFAAAGT